MGAALVLLTLGGARSLNLFAHMSAIVNTPAAKVPKVDDPGVAALELRFGKQIKPLLAQYCYECHGNGEHSGGLRLDQYNSLASIQNDRKKWQSVENLVQLKMMPLEEHPRPTPEQVVTLSSFIEDALGYVDCSGPRDPGRVMLHRLNRNEYNNTIRDLLGIDISKYKPAGDFPADDTGYGFDNIADVLSVSPLLAEKYLAAAEYALDIALVTGNPYKRKLVTVPGATMKATAGKVDENGWNLFENGEVYEPHEFAATADYEFRVRAEADQAGTEPARMVLRLDGKDIKTFNVPAVRGKPEIYILRQRIAGGTHRVAVAFTNDFYDPKNPDPKNRDRNLIVDSVAIDGPIDAAPPPPSAGQQRILFVTPGKDVTEINAAAAILGKFATRAFRRPVRNEEVGRLLKLYRQVRGDGEGFVPSLKVAMSAVLVSPNFLFRVELDPQSETTNDQGGATPAVRLLNDYELATRLSYFLWSSMPDDALFDIAAAGKLHDPQVLEAQVRRMLADPKSKALVRNFVGQWLELRNLDISHPNEKRFPQFDGKLKDAMRREAEMFFASVLHEDRSVMTLLDADYTFVNERLAKHYGIPNIKGDEFQKVSLAGTPAAGQRGGVLTMAGVLTLTSMPARTSPVKRGKWILSEILGDAPPPPPPGVPTLPSKPVDDSPLTFRQRLEQHRVDVTCASCHARMDPLGFALEHYDAIGAWRDLDGSHAIDATGKFPGGQIFDGSEALKHQLLLRQKDFVRCLVEKMLTYALGRGLEEYDRRTVYEICQSVAQSGYKSSSVVLAIVNCDAFQKRRMKGHP